MVSKFQIANIRFLISIPMRKVSRVVGILGFALAGMFASGCELVEPVSNQEDLLITALALTPPLTANAACKDVFNFRDREEDDLKFVRQVGLSPGVVDRFRIFSRSQEVFYVYELVTGPYKIFIYGLGSLSPRLQVCNSKAQPRGISRIVRETGVRYVAADVPAAPPLPPQEVDEETGELIPRPPEDLEGSRIEETTNMRVRYIAPLYTEGGFGFYTISLHTPESVRDNPFGGGGSCVTEIGCFQYDGQFSNARRHCEFLNAGTYTFGGTCGTSRPRCSGALNNGLLSLNGGTRASCDGVFGAREAYFWEE